LCCVSVVIENTIPQNPFKIYVSIDGIVIAIYTITQEDFKMTFEAVVKKGHTGAGNYDENKIYIHASSIIEAMDIAKNRGGVKKGRAYNAGQSVVSIKAVQN
jgi:hypothetical protein